MSVYNEGDAHTPVVCGLCNTDHSNPDDEWYCLESQAAPHEYEYDYDDEPADLEYDDRNPYDGTYDYMNDEGMYDSGW